MAKCPIVEKAKLKFKFDKKVFAKKNLEKKELLLYKLNEKKSEIPIS